MRNSESAHHHEHYYPSFTRLPVCGFCRMNCKQHDDVVGLSVSVCPSVTLCIVALRVRVGGGGVKVVPLCS